MGAHLLLQIRTRVLNDTLTDDYRRWYPGFTHTEAAAARSAVGRGAGCMAPILALRTDGPGQGASHGLSRSPS